MLHSTLFVRDNEGVGKLLARVGSKLGGASMIVVRETFRAKYGKAGEAVAFFKQHQQEFQQIFNNMPTRVMTDLSGRFDTVVLEQLVESIDSYFEITRAAFANPDAAKIFGPMGELFESGTREFYTLEAETGR